MTPLGPARVFGAGLPATGEPAQLALGERELEVRSAAGTARAPFTALRVREVGTGESGLELAWDGADGPRAVPLFGAGALRALRAHPGLAAAPALLALRAARGPRALRRALGWSALALLLLAPLLGLALLFAQADRVARAAVAWIPPEQEARLGELAFAQLRLQLELADDGPAHAAAAALGERLSRGSRYRYRFHVVRSAEVNAFALPGGIVVVHSGLLAATRRPEELAGVLAHEIQHVEQRHSLQALVTQLGLRGLWLLATGDPGGSVLGQLALELGGLRFSREAEAQADFAGFDALVRSGIDPGGMADFFAELARREGDAPPAWLSTHPASAERERQLRERAAALGQRRFEPLGGFSPWPPR